MKAAKLLLLTAFLGLMLFAASPASAQCAACAAAVETNAKSGDHATAGLNNGIMYLLAMPYLAVAIAGYIWHKKYRRKNVELNMRNEKLHLN
ncbi:MAG: hypothetical protein EOP46_17545 [Sphingobacteriaceae bacterium]|nr:MAG: hypothetical protein EOP46_17545 [Sphingobacteriaceae bacterium]